MKIESLGFKELKSLRQIYGGSGSGVAINRHSSRVYLVFVNVNNEGVASY